MLTKTDLKQIENLIVKSNNKQDQQWDKRLIKLRKEMNADIADFIGTTIIPRLDQISDTLNEMQRISDNHEDHLYEHGERIEKLEKIHPEGTHPTI